MATTRHTENSEIKLNCLSRLQPESKRPIKNKPYSSFIIVKDLEQKTAHKVCKAIEEHESEVKQGYLKYIHSPLDKIYSLVAEFEACCAEFYRFLAPNHIPQTYAVYDNLNNNIGVYSEELPEFKSLANDPLKEEDLQIDFIEKNNLSIELMEKLDFEFQELEDKLQQSVRRLKKLKKNEKILEKKLEASKSESEIEQLLEENQTTGFAKINAKKTFGENKKNKLKFYNKIAKEYKITEKQFENYRIVKGLAIGLTTSYIYKEDDLHQNNISKFGLRIDFDMSIWNIGWDFKEGRPIIFNVKEPVTPSIRQPVEEEKIATFKVTPSDISSFPNLKDAKPFYWPSCERSYSNLSYWEIFKKKINWSVNAYPIQATRLYQTLEKNPVFNYHKNMILARYILSHKSIYKQLAERHIRKDSKYRTGLLIEALVEDQEKRIAKFENTLLNVPQFREFFKTHGKQVVSDMIEIIKKQGIDYDAKHLQTTYMQLLEEIEVKEKTLETKESNAPSMLRKLSPEIKSVPEPRSYDKVKDEIIKAMTAYQYPGVIALPGFFRNHKFFAQSLIEHCNNLTPKTDDKNAEIEAILKLNELILRKRNSLEKSGSMYTTLDNLIKFIATIVPTTPNSGLTITSTSKQP